ncbi:acetyltransferase [Vibrio vulnificus]|nr:acetyltransferase [Vibrio vulnificus]
MVSVVVIEFSGMRCQPLRRALYFICTSCAFFSFTTNRSYNET